MKKIAVLLSVFLFFVNCKGMNEESSESGSSILEQNEPIRFSQNLPPLPDDVIDALGQYFIVPVEEEITENADIDCVDYCDVAERLFWSGATIFYFVNFLITKDKVSYILSILCLLLSRQQRVI